MFSKTDVEVYFSSEKAQALLFMIIGVVALLLSIALIFFVKTNLTRGIAIPLSIIAILQVVVGYTVHSRADKQRTDVVYNMDLNPEGLRHKEIPRMQKVMKNFTLYKYIETGLFIIGLLLWLWFKNQPDNSFLQGIGIGLALQAGIMLGADYFAEKRGRIYLIGLTQHVQQ